MDRKVIKIKIGKEDTTVRYSKKIFKNRATAINAAIDHLKRILDFYGVEINEM